MKYTALRTLNGDYGHKHPGDVFEVPDDTNTQKRMLVLEGRGLVMRYRPRVIDRRAYRVVENKMEQPLANKGVK